MEDNKPIQADPSVPATSPDDKSEGAIQERLAEVIAQQKSSDNPILPVAVADKKPEGGNGSDVSSQKDSSVVTDPNAEVLKLVSDALGRNFTSVEEAKKTLTNLNSLVGDQNLAKTREAAKLYDTLVNKFAGEKGITVDEAKRFWADTLVQETAQPVPVSQPKPVVEEKRPEQSDAQYAELKARLDRSELLAKYPSATEFKDEIAIIAKQKGISDLEAFEQSPFKPLVESRAFEESQKSPVVTPSNRTGFDQQKVQELGSRVISRGNEDDKIALVTEMLGNLVK